MDDVDSTAPTNLLHGDCVAQKILDRGGLISDHRGIVTCVEDGLPTARGGQQIEHPVVAKAIVRYRIGVWQHFLETESLEVDKGKRVKGTISQPF